MAKVNLDIAPRLDITCKRGDSFKLVVDFQTAMPSLDGTNSSAYLLKVAEDSESTPNAITFAYDVEDGEASNSQLTVTSSAATTADIEPGLYVYDLQVTDTAEDVFDNVGGSAYIKTLLYGTFRVNDDVDAT
jgi:hypothetical protein